jgi:hypothetical protein
MAYTGRANNPSSHPMTSILPSLSRRLRAAGIVAALLAGPCAFAAEDARTHDEVAHLLDFLDHSGCQFNRNGTWYDAHKARAHLEEKYAYLQKRDLVPSAQAFIERAASTSSMSGKPYQVRCGTAEPVPSGRWLGDELQRYRAAHGAAR